MTKRYFYIGLFIVTIIGLSIVQYQYFRIGLNLAGIQFNEKMGLVIEDVKKELKGKNELTFLVGSAMSKNDLNFRLSLDSLRDASSYFMSNFLKEKLLQKGIKADFGFVIYDKDSIQYMQSSTVYKSDDMLLKYPIILEGYLPELLDKKLSLEIRFKNVNRYFLSQLNGLTIPSIVFIIIIIIVILWVYRAFYLQQNLIVISNEFLNNLTHELKTPVFSIGVATKILEEKGHEEDKKIAGIIRVQVEKLKNQIDKVLELGIIEGKKDFIVKKQVDVKPLLINVIHDFGQIAELMNFEFSGDLEGDSYIVIGDLYHLENTINSLLENSKKYSKDSVQIRLRAYKTKKNLVIEIKDNGIGMAPAELKKIFQKYYRVSQGDLHDVKGYGLGLNYVKRIVHLHKGKVEVESTVNQGSIFTIKIPLA